VGPNPSDKKLVYTKRTSKHQDCFKTDWSDSDPSVVWTSLFYWLGAAEIWDSIITKISYNCVPEGSIVYTWLVPFDSEESRKMREDPLVTASRSTDVRKGGARALVGVVRSRGYYLQLSRDQIPEIYRNYSGWIYGRHPFIVTSQPLPKWEQTLHSGRFFGWRIRKRLLEGIYSVLFNHYEHGFEMIGQSIRPDLLLKVAREVSGEYDLTLQIQEKGNPFGDP